MTDFLRLNSFFFEEMLELRKISVRKGMLDSQSEREIEKERDREKERERERERKRERERERAKAWKLRRGVGIRSQVNATLGCECKDPLPAQRKTPRSSLPNPSLDFRALLLGSLFSPPIFWLLFPLFFFFLVLSLSLSHSLAPCGENQRSRSLDERGKCTSPGPTHWIPCLILGFGSLSAFPKASFEAKKERVRGKISLAVESHNFSLKTFITPKSQPFSCHGKRRHLQ